MNPLSKYKDRYDYKMDLKEALWTVGDNPEHELWAQPAFMMSVGLRKHHKFLDLGCGCLRGTALLVDYLDPGNFYGVDISQSLLDQATHRLKSVDVRNSPNLYCIDDYNMRDLIKVKFDYILSVSILTHVLPKEAPALFNGVADCLSQNGNYYFTIYPINDVNYAGNMELMQYNIQYLKEIGIDNGLIIEDIPGHYPNPCLNYLDKVNTPMMGQWVLKARLA